MAYPKPLSEKTIAKMYAQAGLDSESRDFLHRLFAACANLYGMLVVRDVWHIYQKMQSRVPLLHRKDITAFAAIARREVQPYYVFEIDEIYEDEPRKALDVMIVNGNLVGFGQRRFFQVYQLGNNLRDIEPYIPEDILSCAEPRPTSEEKALISFLGNLTVTEDEHVFPSGKRVPCEHKGERLKDFSYMSSFETFIYNDLENKPKQLEAFMKKMEGNEAEKLVRNLGFYSSVGTIGFNTLLQEIIDELEEVGVLLDEKQVRRLLKLIQDFHNSARMWCLRGWSPNELSARRTFAGTPTMSFGPGLQKAFADGTMNRDEVEAAFIKMGFKIDNT